MNEWNMVLGVQHIRHLHRPKILSLRCPRRGSAGKGGRISCVSDWANEKPLLGREKHGRNRSMDEKCFIDNSLLEINNTEFNSLNELTLMKPYFVGMTTYFTDLKIKFVILQQSLHLFIVNEPREMQIK